MSESDKINVIFICIFRLSALAKSYMDSFSELQINVEALFEKYMEYKEILKPMVRSSYFNETNALNWALSTQRSCDVI